MSGEASWTLDELGARVERALALSDYQPAASGRVRAVPDRRTIRYYGTLGLVDRPGLAGRTALYGPRHLLQLVAIKRLQGEGRTLEAIQQELAGLDSAALARVARVPAEVLEAPSPGPEAPPQRASRRSAFWKAEPAEPEPEGEVRVAPPSAGDGEVQGVSLDDEVMLVWGRERELEPGDILALRAAAAPLLDLLRARGLVRSDR